MADQAKIDAARDPRSVAMMNVISSHLFNLDDKYTGDDDLLADIVAGPRVHFISAQDHPDLPDKTQLITTADTGADPSDWELGLENGLWVQSDRVAQHLARNPGRHAAITESCVAVAVVAHQSVATAPNLDASHTERCWYAMDVAGNTYTARRILTGADTGNVTLTTGYLDPEWDSETVAANAEDYDYENAHVALTRILRVLATSPEMLAGLIADGMFDADKTIATHRQQVRAANAADGNSPLADLRDMVASHGYVPWDPCRPAAT